jgi:hypothetical protein
LGDWPPSTIFLTTDSVTAEETPSWISVACFTTTAAM